MRTAQCKGCGEEIIWTLTRNGKKMPMDAEPSPEGTFIIEWEGDDAHAIYVGLDGGTDRHMSHFSTCERAEDFKR